MAAASSSPAYLPDKRGRRSHGSGRDGGGGTVGTGSKQPTRTARRRARVRRRTQVRPRRSRGGVPRRGRQSGFLLPARKNEAGLPARNNEVGSIFLCFVGFTGWLRQLCAGGSVGAWRFGNAHVARIWAGLQMREFAARLQRILFRRGGGAWRSFGLSSSWPGTLSSATSSWMGSRHACHSALSLYDLSNLAVLVSILL
jgi:hypothetical protein